MASPEQHVKAQFARLFRSSDWRLFRRIADVYLERAAKVRTGDVGYAPVDLRLLVRNVQKRLFIGIGIELLLKAIYLKNGFAINRHKIRKAEPAFPYELAKVVEAALDPDNTFTLQRLITGLSKVPAVGGLGSADRGLRIAKVFRNKEGHVVVPQHVFDPQDYREIEVSLTEVYARAFGESLTVRFSVAEGERSRWSIV